MFEKIDGWLDGQAKNRRMVGGIEKQMTGWIAKQIDGWMDIHMVGWMDKTNRWMDGKQKHEKNR